MKYFTLLFCFFSISQSADLANINYDKAFNQKTPPEFNPLLRFLGCENNIDTATSAAIGWKARVSRLFRRESTNINQPFNQNKEDFENSPDWRNYVKYCLSTLQKARNWAVSEQARTNLQTIAILGAATAATVYFVGSTSLGGSFAAFNAISWTSQMLPEIFKWILGLKAIPHSPLDEQEKKFAVYKCFIPKTLWPTIMENFSNLRQGKASAGDFERLKMLVNLQILKPIPPRVLKPGITIAQAEEILEKKTDEFFKDYDEMSDKVDSNTLNLDPLDTLKMSLKEFLRCLLKPGTRPLRFTYLYGPGGIGKTHFASKVSEWFTEIFTTSVSVDSIYLPEDNSTSVTVSEELEGSRTRPGIMLDVLSRQMERNLTGSVVLMDEASWLNNQKAVSAAKKVFNGKMTKIPTDYFGPYVYADLNCPPILMLLAGNSKIEDQALKSRFNVINFPYPKKSSLLRLAKNMFEESAKEFEMESLKFTKEMQTYVKTLQTYREVEEAVPGLIQKAQIDKRKLTKE